MKELDASWLWNETVGRTIQNGENAENVLSAFGGAVMTFEAPTAIYGGAQTTAVIRAKAAEFLRMWANALEGSGCR